jgi:predicted nucleotidyltransferase
MMTSTKLAFCDEYGYPPVVRERLEIILSLIQKSNLKSINVLLVGSTARGEFSCRTEPDKQISLWSDLEFFVVAEKEPRQIDRTKLLSQLHTLELEWGKTSPLFHIDCSYVSLDTMQHLPPWIRYYEAKQVGKTILGADIRSEIPDINSSNLDYRELAEVILWRLWAIALYAPKDNKNEKEKKDKLFSFVLCRNALDLTTYLLPWENVLLSSFKERAKYITEHYAELQLSKYFDTEFPVFMNTCLRGKFEFIFPESPQQLFLQTLSYFVQAGKHLLAVNKLKLDDTAMLNELVRYQSRLFNEFRLLRKVYELKLIAQYRSQRSILSLWQWYWQGKIGKMISFLYHLHFAFQAIAITDNINEAKLQLDIADELLKQFSLRQVTAQCYDSSIYIGDRWLAQRQSFARFLMDLYQSMGAKEDYINRVLGE